MLWKRFSETTMGPTTVGDTSLSGYNPMELLIPRNGCVNGDECLKVGVSRNVLVKRGTGYVRSSDCVHQTHNKET